jgi:hypothetical protein
VPSTPYIKKNQGNSEDARRLINMDYICKTNRHKYKKQHDLDGISILSSKETEFVSTAGVTNRRKPNLTIQHIYWRVIEQLVIGNANVFWHKTD